MNIGLQHYIIVRLLWHLRIVEAILRRTPESLEWQLQKQAIMHNLDMVGYSDSLEAK